MKLTITHHQKGEDQKFDYVSNTETPCDTKLSFLVGATIKDEVGVFRKIDLEITVNTNTSKINEDYNCVKRYLLIALYSEIRKIFNDEYYLPELSFDESESKIDNSQIDFSLGKGITLPIGDYEFIRLYMLIKNYCTTDLLQENKKQVTEFIDEKLELEIKEFFNYKIDKDGFLKWVFQGAVPADAKPIKAFGGKTNYQDPEQYEITFGKFKGKKLLEIALHDLISYHHNFIKTVEKPTGNLSAAKFYIEKYFEKDEIQKELQALYSIKDRDNGGKVESLDEQEMPF